MSHSVGWVARDADRDTAHGIEDDIRRGTFTAVELPMTAHRHHKRHHEQHAPHGHHAQHEHVGPAAAANGLAASGQAPTTLTAAPVAMPPHAAKAAGKAPSVVVIAGGVLLVVAIVAGILLLTTRS
jgi:hypothetical protein